MSDAEIERAVVKAIKKHLRDETLSAALAWLKVRVDLCKQVERLG